MEKDFESWFHYQHSERQSPNLNSLSDPLGVGRQTAIPACMNLYTNEVPTNGTLPSFVFSGLPQSKASQAIEPHNWFYCLPRFRQAFVPPINSVLKEKLPSGHIENCGGTESPNTGTGCTQNKFLVFDQSGDQTTLIYSSGLGGPPVQCLTSLSPKLPAPYDLFKEDLGIKRDAVSPFSPFLSYEHNEENHRNDVDGEMHEDTEELNALLYSDDDAEYSDDDEVTSTGHSPSTMTDHGVHQCLEEGEEEVASSFGPTKRRKLLDGGYDMLSPVGTASPETAFKFSEFEGDAESSCGNFDNHVSEESNSLSGKKRSRKEKIRETVNILQSIIPGGKGKDAVVVIDEAIHYLKSLRVKAKALGLDGAL